FLPQLDRRAGLTSAARVVFSFWLRRMWRLWPAAWAWLAIILVCVLCFNSSGAFGTLRANLYATLAGVLQYANIRFMHTFGVSEYGVSFVYWSLALEEQFYLVFPIIALMGRRYLLFVLVVILSLQLFANKHHSALLMMFRIDGIALGVLLAMWSQTQSYLKFNPAAVLASPILRSLVVSSLIVALAVLATPKVDLFFKMGLIAVISAVLVWMASYNEGIIFPDCKVRRILEYVGCRSYAIYLVHVPVFFFTREVWGRVNHTAQFDPSYFYLFLGTALVLVWMMSDITYRLIEVPLRKRGALLAKRLQPTA
ncbi:MAG TPA: acyltransferase, partial [Pseudomonadales bacterium]|nr:acyltransferase [Pseudomonadales bacterium]